MANAMTFSLCPVNEVKLLAFFSLFAVAFLTGPVTGLPLGWRHNWIGKLTGLALGFAVGALAVVALAHMVDAAGRDLVPVPGEPNRFTFPCGPPDLFGNVTLGWTILYAVKVAATILTTKFATTALWSIGPTIKRSAMRLERHLHLRSGSK